MSSSGDDGLERLLSAVFQGDEPTAELLARYAREPQSLAPEARREIERALAGRPDLADEVRTLRSFRMPDVADAPAARAPRRSRWRRPAFAAMAAAAALLLFALSPDGQRWLEGPGGPPAPQAPGSAATGAATPEQPEPPQEQQASVPPSPAPEQVAEAPAPAPQPTPEQVAQAPQPSPSPVAPAQVALREPTPAPSPAPRPVAPGPIAMLEPSYSRPAEALDRHRMVVAMRGPTPGGVALDALAPEHVALTRSAAPELFWKLSGRLPEGAKLLFRMLEERSGESLVETELPVPAADGLQRVRLADQGATLAPGVIYTWFIVLRPDPENPARDQLAQGWIERREADVAPTEAAALPAELARAGLWYDALAAALDLREREPSNASVDRGVRALLAQGGVPVEP